MLRQELWLERCAAMSGVRGPMAASRGRMRFLLCIVFLLFLFPKTTFSAAPMTVKDVALMIRLGVTEAEIIAEVEKRRLLTPIDAAARSTPRSRRARPGL